MEQSATSSQMLDVKPHIPTSIADQSTGEAALLENASSDNSSSALNMKVDELVRFGVGRRRNRANNWTEHDKVLAAQKVIEYEHALYGTKDMGHDMASKREAWVKVTEEFCAEADEPRTAEQLKKAFENMRSAARKYIETDEVSTVQFGTNQRPKSPSPSTRLLIKKLRDSFGQRFLDNEDSDSRDMTLSASRRSSVSSDQVDDVDRPWRLTGPFAHNGNTAVVSAFGHSRRKRKHTSYDSDIEADAFSGNSLAQGCSYVPYAITKRQYPNIHDKNMHSSDDHVDIRHINQGSADDNGSENQFSAHDNKYTFDEGGQRECVTGTRYRKSLPKQIKRPETPTTNDSLEYWETQKVKAEYEKLKMETELIKQRMEQEAAIYNLKRRSLEAKIHYYNSEVHRNGK